MSYIPNWIAADLGSPFAAVVKTIELFKNGATIPFIARYRKEATGSLDEVQLSEIRRLWQQYEELEKRKQTVLAAIQEQGKLTDELQHAISNCRTPASLEDIYLPYKQKRKTKASIARENGLESLANFIMEQRNGSLNDIARSFVKNDVKTIDDALEGARHILAERISEHAEA